MLAIDRNAALLLIDVQKGFDESAHWGQRNNPGAEVVMLQLLELWRKTGRPVLHVRHMSAEPDSPLRPGQQGNEFKEPLCPAPDEPVIVKQVNSAFIATTLEQHLHDAGIDTVILVGISTDHCLSTTARMAGNLGFTTYVVADAAFTFNRTAYDGTKLEADVVHCAALASLHNEFATVVDSHQIIAALAMSETAHR